jgi:hypothetical protein
MFSIQVTNKYCAYLNFVLIFILWNLKEQAPRYIFMLPKYHTDYIVS